MANDRFEMRMTPERLRALHVIAAYMKAHGIPYERNGNLDYAAIITYALTQTAQQTQESTDDNAS